MMLNPRVATATWSQRSHPVAQAPSPRTAAASARTVDERRFGNLSEAEAEGLARTLSTARGMRNVTFDAYGARWRRETRACVTGEPHRTDLSATGQCYLTRRPDADPQDRFVGAPQFVGARFRTYPIKTQTDLTFCRRDIGTSESILMRGERGTLYRIRVELPQSSEPYNLELIADGKCKFVMRTFAGIGCSTKVLEAGDDGTIALTVREGQVAGQKTVTVEVFPIESGRIEFRTVKYRNTSRART
ncbi:hypothetical protein [Pararobbsia silviterrae]|uniref:Uncharacterized protein n=1 Tax=Pararobbsia silviterrae TaxID=1792498 RepID=A0A494XCX7_9BURK|nr:hypothetical protein [Pararobbsia silviterrae]RKP48605.1 hypothetical protein D7S86_21610 [Pararobbsia silviterrae]